MILDTPLFPGAPARMARYPEIRHLDDVAHRVDPERGVHLFTQEDVLILRYVTARPNTFETELDLECRSLIFDRESGDLLSRSLHKFFNLGEREGLADLPLEEGADLSLKIDGTMLSAFTSPPRAGELRFHTKGGLTEHAARGLALAPPNVIALALEAIGEGGTPTFEWTSPENRVVIPYAETEFRLIAIRDRVTGAYLEGLADDLARKYGVARPGSLGRVTGLTETAEALTRLGARTDIEGAVLTFADGHRVKWKTKDYHARHKVLANIEHERRVYQCWFEGVGDDTAASLGGERGRALLAFLEEIETAISTACGEIAAELAPLTELPPADRAAKVRDRFSGVRQSVAFSMLKGYDGREAVHRIAAGRIGSEEGRESLKRELGLPSWTIDIQALR
jgi:RNA ligase